MERIVYTVRAIDGGWIAEFENPSEAIAYAKKNKYAEYVEQETLEDEDWIGGEDDGIIYKVRKKRR